MDEQKMPNGSVPSSMNEFVAYELGRLRSTVDQVMPELRMQRGLLLQLSLSVTSMQPRTSASSTGAIEWLGEISKRLDLAHKLYRIWVLSRAVRWPAYAYGALRFMGWA